MATDFRADQVRLNRLIASGSKILVYPSSSASDLQGGQTAAFSTGSVGTDVFFFVSGSSTAKSVFGGDLHVSGNFTVGGTGGSTVLTSSLIDFMDKQGYDPSSLGGSYTIGMGFFVAASASLTNFKVDWHGLSSKTLSIKLWNQAGTCIGAVSQSVSANASVVGAFTSSISLDPYKYYYLSYWEDSASDYHLYYSLYTGYAAYKFLGPSAQYYRGTRIRSDVIFTDGYLYAAGDALPTTSNTDTNLAAIEPIIP